MAKTEGNNVVIFIEGEPITCSTGYTAPNSLIDWSNRSMVTETIFPPITFSGGFKFEPTPKEVKTEMEYYMHRKGTYYLREQKPPFRKIIFSIDEVPEDLKTLKYGTLIQVTVGYEDAKMTE